MFGFVIKKWFFDYWDNFFRISILNIIFILFNVVGISLGQLVLYFMQQIHPWENIYILVPLVFTTFAVNIFFGASSGMMNDIADFKTPGVKDFLGYLKTSLPSSLIYSLICSVLFTLFVNAATFYFGTDLGFGPLAFALIFWAAIVWLNASQYFWAIHYRLDKNFMKKFKKMFLIFFDNPLFTIILFLFTLAIMAVSVPTLLMIPGFVAYQLVVAVGLKLRLYKYDYLEEKNLPAKSKIPWNALLQKDRERVGKRTFKNTFMPWQK